MTSWCWPGDHRAEGLLDDDALLAALLRVESAWSRALVAAGIAPAAAAFQPDEVDLDPSALAAAAESGGNPVIPVVAQLRERLPGPAAAWAHRGLTSQDALDSAIMLLARDAVERIRAEVDQHVALLAALAREYRDSPIAARTLTQPAVATTFGLKVAAWLRGVLDARDDLTAVRLPVQLGGAAGTLAALVELGGVAAARECRSALARLLGLEPSSPWHTGRAPVTRLGEVAVRASAAWGHLANDVLVLGRPEIGEVTEGHGGGSSTLPGKANPTLSVLVRRHALAAPQLVATLHLAAAEQVDERADGGWHLEWSALATLLRRTCVAASQTTDLLAGLRVDDERMARRVAELGADLSREQQAMARLRGGAPRDEYRGLLDDVIGETLDRASRPVTEETP